MARYVIKWDCTECGISGEDKHEAWKKFEPVVEHHDDHSNFFSRMEGYEDKE